MELLLERQFGNEKGRTNQPSVEFTNNACNATAAMDEIHSIILTRSAARIAMLLLCAPGEEMKKRILYRIVAGQPRLQT
ncbi:hypothetical protein I7I49_18290 [Sinorhizobium meliloti]|uniref:hypothetical protein n=1 Tax=Rhizobium meliloti TaxID=382 RepID=UPI00237F2A7C|nr:hypothetical protein [Sinorhizobium meliloti]MDE3812209.1 hypothetical protein [Sinorhizobium meliloti]